MCTAIGFTNKDFYFGRTLDLSYSYKEEVVVMPRNFPMHFRHVPDPAQHYAIIGVATVMGDTPLYYDAANEKGLCMAGLNFPGNACFHPEKPDVYNVASFEMVTWVLGQCETVAQARTLMEKTNIVPDAFSEGVQPAPLHWIVADRDGAITIESTSDGIHIYDNPISVLANNPPFPYQMMHLNDYMNLTPYAPENRFSDKVNLESYTHGMGAFGLPGDPSSASRFVRVAFHKLNSVCGETEEENVSQFFHLLGSVDEPRGSVRLENDVCDLTIYTDCCNASKGIYYYTTYEGRQVSAVDMHQENLDGEALSRFPMEKKLKVQWHNR